MNTATHTTVPVASTFEFAHTLYTLQSREDSTSESVNLIAIITSLAGVIITVVGLILGYIYWKYPRKAASPNLRSSLIPGTNPSPPTGPDFDTGRMHALWLAFLPAHPAPTPPGHEIDLEFGRVSTLHSETDITVEPGLASK